MTVVKLKVGEVEDRHRRVSVLAGPDEDHLALTGTLRMLPEEVDALVTLAFAGSFAAKPDVEFVLEEAK